ncbi:Gibberellin-regulated protein 1 [Dionaea muscipula]
MAISKALIVSLLISLLLLQLVECEETVNEYTAPAPVKIDCTAACSVRCSLSSRSKMCHRACGTCCARCNCVPPGTSGNQKDCACYYNMTTHDDERKCP